MDIFVARQPIFDRRGVVIAYELLFRAGLENAFPAGMSGDVASSRVINDSLMVFGFDTLTAGKQAYVNVTHSVLTQGLYGVLPGRRTVIEVLETVTPDAEAVAACKGAKKAGYDVALDDFVYRPEMEALLPMADVVKIDLLATDADTRKAMPQRLARHRCKLLAEKVETRAQYDEVLQEGYAYFQGYFFARPEIVARKDVPTSKLVYIQFLRELARDELDFGRLEQVIKQDVGLSVKLLRYLNSAWFGWRCQVRSLKQAIVMLGERPFRQWASLVAVVGIAADRPAELANVCLQRARFCELVAPRARASGTGGELDSFLVGLLSAMDALVGRPLPEILKELAVSTDVERALCGDRSNRLGQLVELVVAYERGAWPEVASLAAALGLSDETIATAYRETLDWVRTIVPSREVATSVR